MLWRGQRHSPMHTRDMADHLFSQQQTGTCNIIPTMKAQTTTPLLLMEPETHNHTLYLQQSKPLSHGKLFNIVALINHYQH